MVRDYRFHCHLRGPRSEDRGPKQEPSRTTNQLRLKQPTSLGSRSSNWQDRRESNPQPPVLETGALPIELLSFVTVAIRQSAITNRQSVNHQSPIANHLVSRCGLWQRQ